MTGLTVVLAGSIGIQTAFAESAGVGNELEMQFNVTEFTSLVNLTWKDGGQAPKSFDSKKGVAQKINYVIEDGKDFIDYELDPQTVNVMLEITDADPGKIETVEAGGVEVESTTINGSESVYYLLKGNVQISKDMEAIEGTLEITFNAVTGATPFTAKIVTLKEEAPKAPVLTFTTGNPYGSPIGYMGYHATGLTQAWANSITACYYSTNGGSSYTQMNVNSCIVDFLNEEVRFTTNVGFGYMYKIVADGYEDVIAAEVD